MKLIEYGINNNDIIVLLHGGGLSWWNYKDVAEILKKDYHVVMPILDGHADSDNHFISIEENAKEIIDYINQTFNGKVKLIGGLSLGGQVALEILSLQNDICDYAIIESALVIPSKLTHSLIKPAFGSCYGLIKKPWFSKLQFKSLHINKTLFDDYFRDTCKISKADMISFLEANSIYELKNTISKVKAKVHIFVGGKESKKMKKSAKKIHDNISGSIMKVVPKKYHGEFSINCYDDYANQLISIISNS